MFPFVMAGRLASTFLYPTLETTPMSHYSDVLVATDGSEPASRAVDHATSLADGIDDTVYVLSVADRSENLMAFDAESYEGVETAVDRTADTILDHAGQADVEGAVREGTPADEILSFADDEDVDVVVLGRSRKSGLAEQILGSTADRVVQHATRPVVLVPPA